MAVHVSTDAQGRRRIRFTRRTFNTHFHPRNREEDARFETAGPFQFQRYHRGIGIGNLGEPVRTAERALWWYQMVKRYADECGFPRFEFYVAPVINDETTPEDIYELADLPFVRGIKTLPWGGTTGAHAGGISNFFADRFRACLQAAQDINRSGTRFNWYVHAEWPDQRIPPVLREPMFVPTLGHYGESLPDLPISVEHVSKREMIAFVRAGKGRFGGGLTSHHIRVTTHMADADDFLKCMPYPGNPSDAEAVLEAMLSGEPWWYLGTDDAPHLKHGHKLRQDGKPPASGVFSGPCELEEIVATFARHDRLEHLEDFVCINGARQNDLPDAVDGTVEFVEEPYEVPDEIATRDGNAMVPYRRGEMLAFRLAVDAAGRALI